mgnify:CR=1 FL=1
MSDIVSELVPDSLMFRNAVLNKDIVGSTNVRQRSIGLESSLMSRSSKKNSVTAQEVSYHWQDLHAEVTYSFIAIRLKQLQKTIRDQAQTIRPNRDIFFVIFVVPAIVSLSRDLRRRGVQRIE